MNCKRLLSVVTALIFSLPAFAQQISSTDSIKQAIHQQKGYTQKTDLLQAYLQKIYLTRYDETIELAQLGYNLASRQNDILSKGNFLRFTGGAYNKKGNIDSASLYYYKALTLLESAGNSKPLGLLYDDLGRMYRKLQQPGRALEFYDKALALYEAANDLEGIARINNESGVVFRDQGNYAEADKRFGKSLYIQRKRNDSTGIGYSLEFLGYNQLLLTNYRQAEAYLKQALEIRLKLKDNFALMLNYTALGEFYNETGRYRLSNTYFEKSNDLAQQIHFADIQQYNYKQLAGNYEALGNYKQALHSLKQFHILNDSIYNIQKMNAIEEITARYESAEKEKQILEQRTRIAEDELRIKNRNQWIFGLMALTLIVALTGFLVYKQQTLKNLKQKQESALKLALENTENRHKLQEQRMSISRDLHDNIGAQLSFIISAIDTIKYYAKDHDELLIRKLNNIGNFSRETIQELRDTIWAINRPGISIRDLQSRIVNFIEKAKQAQNHTDIILSVNPSVSENETFTGVQGLNIFRIVQEALNNALKHAEAAYIHIEITKMQQSICFRITDNGKGFTENDTDSGNGLLNMQKRALELGNVLEIHSQSGTGTEIIFHIRKTH